MCYFVPNFRATFSSASFSGVIFFAAQDGHFFRIPSSSHPEDQLSSIHNPIFIWTGQLLAFPQPTFTHLHLRERLPTSTRTAPLGPTFDTENPRLLASATRTFVRLLVHIFFDFKLPPCRGINKRNNRGRGTKSRMLDWKTRGGLARFKRTVYQRQKVRAKNRNKKKEIEKPQICELVHNIRGIIWSQMRPKSCVRSPLQQRCFI